MDFWPSYLGKHSELQSKSTNYKPSHESWRYPVIEYGALTAASLDKDGISWRTLGGHRNAKGLLWHSAEHVKVFPSTRPLEPLGKRLTTKRRAENGAQFLRTYQPDIDIPFELILDSLKDEEGASKDLHDFDPYLGRLLEGILLQDTPKKQGMLLAFRMGEYNNQLNISSFVTSGNFCTFSPSAFPVCTFDTPILQLLSSPPLPKFNQLLAVRTMGKVQLFTIGRGISTKAGAQAEEVFTINPDDCPTSKIMDMSFATTVTDPHPVLWLIDDQGRIQRTHYGGGWKNIHLGYDFSVDGFQSQVWRIVAGSDMHNGIVMSDKWVKMFDDRTAEKPTHLFNPADDLSLVTSIDSPVLGGMTCLSTTEEIVWLDHRNTKRPLLGWRHHRVHDRSLQVQCRNISPSSSLTVLSSLKTGLVTAYEIEKTDGKPICTSLDPTVLPTAPNRTQLSSMAFIQHPSHELLSLFSMSDTGSVHRLDMQYGEESGDNTALQQGRTHIWSAQVEELENKSLDLQPDLGKFGLKEFSTYDFSELYEKILRLPDPMNAETRDADIEEVYAIADQMGTFWQRSEDDGDRLLTIADIASGSGDDSSSACRADFLRETALNSNSGTRAWRQGRLPVSKIKSRAQWNLDLRPILERIADHSYDFESRTAIEPFLHGIESEQAQAHARNALEQLSMEIDLASDVVSFEPFYTSSNARAGESDPLEAATMLSEATQALSLNRKEPPPFHFRHFKLVPQESPIKDDPNTEGEAVDLPEEKEVTIPPGVRLLLGEWALGQDPDTYEYKDPYATEEAPLEPAWGKEKLTPGRTKGRTGAQATYPQQPPTIIAASQIQPPTILQSRSQPTSDIFPQSQPTEKMQASQSSQPIFSSTQILPGPHGGRPAPKKPAKKRMGGF